MTDQTSEIMLTQQMVGRTIRPPHKKTDLKLISVDWVSDPLPGHHMVFAKKCESCKGKGEVVLFQYPSPCKDCNGKGSISSNP